ncbi:MAG: Ku protein [bacterium]|nr:Ku protein [bacterium]
MKAINSTFLTAGLISVPVKIYTAAQSLKVSFCQLSPDLHRVKQQWVDASTGKAVDRSDFKRGFEYSKGRKNNPGKSVEITDAELDSLSPKDPAKAIEIKEFIKEELLPTISIDKTYYLGPDISGERGYALFTQVMSKKDVCALAQWTVRGRQQLVAIRPYKNGSGLVLQQLFYSDEIRPFSDIGVTNVSVSQSEVNMAEQFVDAMTSRDYSPEKYKNEYAASILALVNKKVNGEAINITSPAPMSHMDMVAQLQATLNQLQLKTG